MTTYIDSDTSGFEKGLKQAKKDLKDFDRTCKESLRSIGDMFGVPTGKLEQMAGATRELGRRMEEMGGTGEKALGKVLKSCSNLAAGIAGIGIAGAVAAFKALSAEAQNFSNTIDGLNFKMQSETWLSTYRQAMHDANQATGQSFAQLWQGMQRAWTDMGSTAGSLIVNGFNVGKTFRDRAGARANANDAAYAANELADVQKALLANDKQLADLEQKIAAARLVAYDTKNAEDIAAYADLINQKYNLQEPILRKIYELTAEINSYSNDTVEDVEKENAAYRAWTDLAATRDNELKSLLRLQKSITKEVTTQKEETDQWASIIENLQDALRLDRADLNFWGIEEALNKPGGLLSKASTQASIEIEVHPVYNKQEILDFAAEAETMLEDALVDVATLLGNAIGDAFTGGDVWKNFGQDALNMLAEFAIKIGEIAIAAGVTVKALKTIIKNPLTAIAAGTGLVALGAAIKAGLSNAQNSIGGNASYASSSVASGSSSMGMSDISAAAMSIKVTGKLEAQGSTLVAVIDSENNRKSITT